MKLTIDTNDLPDLLQKEYLLKLALVGIEALIEKSSRSAPMPNSREAIYSNDDH